MKNTEIIDIIFGTEHSCIKKSLILKAFVLIGDASES